MGLGGLSEGGPAGSFRLALGLVLEATFGGVFEVEGLGGGLVDFEGLDLLELEGLGLTAFEGLGLAELEFLGGSEDLVLEGTVFGLAVVGGLVFDEFGVLAGVLGGMLSGFRTIFRGVSGSFSSSSD